MVLYFHNLFVCSRWSNTGLVLDCRVWINFDSISWSIKMRKKTPKILGQYPTILTSTWSVTQMCTNNGSLLVPMQHHCKDVKSNSYVTRITGKDNILLFSWIYLKKLHHCPAKNTYYSWVRLHVEYVSSVKDVRTQKQTNDILSGRTSLSLLLKVVVITHQGPWWRHSLLMVSLLDSGSSSPGQGNCVEFLGKTLSFSLTILFSTEVYK